MFGTVDGIDTGKYSIQKSLSIVILMCGDLAFLQLSLVR